MFKNSKIINKIIILAIIAVLIMPNILLTTVFAIEVVDKNEEQQIDLEIENLEEELAEETIKGKTTIETNKTNISATQKSEVIFTINLNDEKNYEAPELKIELPETFETIEIKEINIINGDTLQIAEQKVEDKNIILQLQGKKEVSQQRAQITIKTDIKVRKGTSTKTEEIKLIYGEEEYRTEIKILAKEEVILSNKITIGEIETEAFYYEVKEQKYNKENLKEKIKIELKAVNNTGEYINNFEIIGKIGFNKFVIKQVNELQLSKDVTIKFAQNQEGPWKEILEENDRYFKIEKEEFLIGEEISLEYIILLDEDLVQDENLKNNYTVQYNNMIIASPEIILIQDNSATEEKPPIEENITTNSLLDVVYSTQIYHNNDVVEEAKIGSKIEYYATIKNIKENLEKAQIKINIPEGTELIKTNLYKKNKETNQFEAQEDAIIDVKDNVATIQSALTANEEYIFLLEVQVVEFKQETITNKITIEKQTINENYNPENEEEQEYINEEISKNEYNNVVINKAELQISANTDRENEELNAGEEIRYNIYVKNNSNITEKISYEISIPDEIEVQKITVKSSETENSLEGANYLIDSNKELLANDFFEMQIIGKVNSIEETRTVNAEIQVLNNKYTFTNTINLSEVNDENENNNQQEENNQNNNGNNNNENSEIPGNNENTYSISGKVWLDKNKDGNFDKNEPNIKGVLVKLWNNDKQDYVRNEDNSVRKVITDNDGQYIFENLKIGDYTVIFEYNKNTYSATTYKSANEEQEGSSALTVTEESKNITKTDTIKLTSQNIQNINLGLVFNQIFDMELTKNITKLTIETNKGRETYQYENGTQLAKSEIQAKQINGAKIIVEYEIKIKNAGAIPGYATKIVDNVPSGYEFNSELNPSWYKGEDGKLYSAELANTIINSGEEKTIKLVLIKNLTEESVGTITNTAEIYETFNEYALQDKDSIEGNQLADEDDLSKADLIISIKTGSPTMYTGLIFTCIAIIGCGIYLVDKKLLRKYEIM